MVTAGGIQNTHYNLVDTLKQFMVLNGIGVTTLSLRTCKECIFVIILNALVLALILLLTKAELQKLIAEKLGANVVLQIEE